MIVSHFRISSHFFEFFELFYWFSANYIHKSIKGILNQFIS